MTTPGPSVLGEIKADIRQLAVKAERIDEGLVGKLEQLAGNPVVDALLAAAHVPAGALSIVVSVLEGLGKIYAPADTAADGSA